ncbi:MAG: TonB-dependent receptor, partial [Rhodothermales bacterium]|nr:TonB-dependent receptor [Rhodothermales bacterium]
GSRTVTVPRRLAVDLSPRQFESMGRRDLSEALPLVPGVVLQRIGPRNEAGVRLRGFDLRHVPLYVDGIPVYVPYDGFVDLARYLTTDVARITVERGFSSLLYGSNGLAGAVNIVTRAPVSRLEGNVNLGWQSPRGRQLSLTLGTRNDWWFAIANVAYVEQPSFTMSSSFESAPAEDGGRRDNADRSDKRVSARLGFVPRMGTTVAIGYLMQSAEKGNPPYAGSESGVGPRYWRWPLVDKKSVYLLADHALGESVSIRIRGFYDWFDSSLFSYDDATFVTQSRPYAFQQHNDDESLGGSVVLSASVFPRHKIAVAAHVKRDGHDESDDLRRAGQFRDMTWSVAIEDEWDFGWGSSLVAGVSFERRKSLAAERFDLHESFPTNANEQVNAHIGAVKDVADNGHIYVSFGRRTRFPTIKDRYSYREGRALPNPGLLPERATHVELGVDGSLSARARVRAALFAASVGDVIQAVDIVEPESGRTLAQLQNSGRARHLGGEISVQIHAFSWLGSEVTYAYLHLKNLTDPELVFTHTPVYTVSASVRGAVHPTFSLACRFENAGPLYSRVDGTTLTKVSGHTKVDRRGGLRGVAEDHDKRGSPECARCRLRDGCRISRARSDPLRENVILVRSLRARDGAHD